MALPTNLFNANWYLAQNLDVARAIEQGLIASAEEHFNNFGKYEGRSASPLFNTQDYLAANPDVADAIEAGLTTAYDHFVQYGAAEGRSPTSLFDPDFYLAQNPDVAAAVEAGLISATEHFLLYGQGEPRYINPVINLGAYLGANSDLAQAAESGVISPLVHLLTYGVAEGRDLGNGVNLNIFANDPAFKDAVSNGNLQAALERVQDVAPFLPTFAPPANWQPAADTPIPVDFTPPEGIKLVIPPSVVVPDDVELPEDVFEPVTPPTPGPTPGGGSSTFKVTETGGVVTFSGGAKGEISIKFSDGQDAASATANFTRGGVAATHAVEDFDAKTLNFVNESVTIAGAGDSVGKLNLKLDAAHVTLPADKGKNLLVDTDDDTPKSLKELNIKAAGASSVDLGNHVLGPDGVGYFLGAVTVEGHDADSTLEIGTLYFGSESTKFDARHYSGDVHLDAYVYHGSPAYTEWEIIFGSGDDVLHLLNDPDTMWDVPPEGNTIDGGAGDDTLIMELNGTFKVPSAAKFQDFEHIVLNHSGAMTEQINAGVFEGAKQIEQVGNIAGSIFNLADGQKAAFTNTSNSGYTQKIGVSYGESVISAALVLNDIASDTHFAIHGAEVKNLTIEGSVKGGGGIEGQLTFSALPGSLESLTLNMDSRTNIGLYTPDAITPFVKAKKIDGSSSTGDLVLEMEGLPESALSSIFTGFGDDLIRLSVDSLNGEKVSISTGAGHDELILTGPSDTGKQIILASEGDLRVDASSLKNVSDDTKIVVSDLGETMTIKVAELGNSGNKSDLGDGTSNGARKSNQEIHLNGNDLSSYEGTLVIENMTISSTSGYAHSPVQNDTIHFLGMLGDDVEDFAESVISFTVSKGAPLSSTLDYVTFEMKFDLDGDLGADFTLVLENIVSANVYNNMLRALDTLEDGKTTLDLINNEGSQPDLTNGDNFTDYKFDGFDVVLGEPAISGLIGILINEETFVLSTEII